MRIFRSFAIPGGPILLGVVLCVGIVAMPETPPEFTRFLSLAVFGSGILLGARFHSSQMVLALVALALADVSVYFLAPADGAMSARGHDLLAAVPFLLPLNLIILAVPPYRGIFTPSTLARLAVILCLPLLATAIHLKWPGEVAATLLVDLADIQLVGGGLLGQPGWVLYLAALAWLPAQQVHSRNAMVGGLFWALAAALFAFNAQPTGLPYSLYMSAAGVILIVSQVESSYMLVFRDDLTELPSRRALDQTLPRLGRRYTIAMVDIDHFKRFNDTYGHQVGDQLLRMVGFKLARLTGGGSAFRYGGEEFALLFPGKSLRDALPHVEAVVESIRSTPFTIRASRSELTPSQPTPSESAGRQRVKVTVSVGVSAARTPTEVLGEADQALYLAKDGGRDRIATLEIKATDSPAAESGSAPTPAPVATSAPSPIAKPTPASSRGPVRRAPKRSRARAQAGDSKKKG